MEHILCSPGGTRYILDKFGIRAKKKFGQNFLIDANVVNNIIQAAEITKDDCVLEIGPGIGTMTQLLSDAAGQVVCVEIDDGLQPILEETLEDCENVYIYWQDVLKTDLKEIQNRFAGGKPLKVVANLPYYVTTPVIMKLLEEKGLFESITVMVQKEVADRIRSGPGKKEYGAISLAVQYYAQPEIVMNVPPSCFIPRPNVDSTVLCLKAWPEPPVETNEEFMFALIRASFNQRRKTLANGLTHGLDYRDVKLTREEVTEALGLMGLSASERGEKLSLEQFAQLANILLKNTEIQ